MFGWHSLGARVCACVYCMGTKVAMDWLNKHIRVPHIFPSIYSLFSVYISRNLVAARRGTGTLIDGTLPNRSSLTRSSRQSHSEKGLISSPGTVSEVGRSTLTR